MEGISGVSELPGAGQSRGGSGSSVGRRSSVSSSSARWASLASDHPRARAIRSATSHVGFAVPRSMPRMVRSSTFAASASASWLSPLSRRRRPIARPRAACGVGLGRTPEDSARTARMNRNYVSGYDLASMEGYSMSRRSSPGVVWRARASARWTRAREAVVRTVSEESGLWSQRYVQRLAVARLNRLGERDELREAPSQRAGDAVDRAVGQVRTSVLDVRDPALVLAELKPQGLLGHFEFFSAQADRTAERDLRFLGGVGHLRNPRCYACSWLWNGFHIEAGGSASRPCGRLRTAWIVAGRRYSMSRSRSAGVVPRARASRRSMVVVGSRRAFSSLLMCERSTPLRRDRTTCEIPVASRVARRLAAS